VRATLAAQLSNQSRMRMQPESDRNPAIEWLWALAVHQVQRNSALWLYSIGKLARRRTQLKIFRRPAIAQWLSPVNPNVRQGECSSPKVAVVRWRQSWLQLKIAGRPRGIRRYRAIIGFRASCRLNSTLEPSKFLLAKAGFHSEQVASRAVANSRRFGGLAAQKLWCAR